MIFKLMFCNRVTFVLIFSTLLLIAGSVKANNTPSIFSGYQIQQATSQPLVKKKRQQINGLTGRFLIDTISSIQTSGQWTILDKEYLLMQSVVRLRKLIVDDNRIAPLQQMTYLNKLTFLSEMKSVSERWLEDGSNRQIIKAFPFASAAKSSINAIHDRIKSNSLLILLEDYQYAQLTEILLMDQKRQLNLLLPAIARLTPSKIDSLLEWSIQQKLMPDEAVFLIALYAKNLTIALGFLKRNSKINFHAYFKLLSDQFAHHQRFDFFKQTAQLAEYASTSIYQIDGLDIGSDIKQDYLIACLADRYSGSSAAHVLSRKLSVSLIEQLAEMVIKDISVTAQKNAALALILSSNIDAKQKISDLYQAKLIAPKLAKELPQWLK